MTDTLKELWSKLSAPQQLAIEFRYLGYSYTEIAERIGDTVTRDMIGNWFRVGGTLEAIYYEYAKSMSEERMENMRKTLKIQDDEWMTHSTNAVRVWASWNTQPKKVPLINKKGDAVFDKNGDIVMVEYIPPIKFADVIRAFVLQRTLSNKPARFDPRLSAPEEDEKVQQAIKDLNLTALDFTEENKHKTYDRIDEYLSRK